MRFKKGTKVEVLSKAEVPSGSWLCAEIVRGKGRRYTVRYEGFLGATDEDIVERVSRKSIRPCPPTLELVENWTPGDIVEVYQNFSWKMATVLKVLGKKYISVRLLGSSLEFHVTKFDIRVRQSWQHDKWFVVGKVLLFSYLNLFVFFFHIMCHWRYRCGSRSYFVILTYKFSSVLLYFVLISFEEFFYVNVSRSYYAIL
jgi:hypothetical protein